jgi:hypothetical protein
VIETRVTHTKKRRSAFDGYQPRSPVGSDVRRGCQAQYLAPDAGAERCDRAAGRGGRRDGRNRQWRRLPLQCSLQPAQRRGIARENLAHSWRPGESASSESGAERAGPPAAARAQRANRPRGSPVVQRTRRGRGPGARSPLRRGIARSRGGSTRPKPFAAAGRWRET